MSTELTTHLKEAGDLLSRGNRNHLSKNLISLSNVEKQHWPSYHRSIGRHQSYQGQTLGVPGEPLNKALGILNEFLTQHHLHQPFIAEWLPLGRIDPEVFPSYCLTPQSTSPLMVLPLAHYLFRARLLFRF